MRHAVGELDEADCQTEEQAADERRMLLEQPKKRRARNDDTDGVFQGARAGGEWTLDVGGNGPKRISLAEISRITSLPVGNILKIFTRPDAIV